MFSDVKILGLPSKDAEVFLCVSFTVNFCVLWHIVAPFAWKNLARCVGGKHIESFIKISQEAPGVFNRFCTSLLFYTVLPVCGIVLLCTTKVLQDPFFAFDKSLRIVFSINTGYYVFKTAQVTYYRRNIPHYQAILIHHSVVIVAYMIIVHFEQNAISGVIGLLIEGNLVFAEFERLMKLLKVERVSTAWKTNMIFRTVFTVIGKALVPMGLLCYAFVTSSKTLFKMEYVPLAFFFLSLVFFSSVNVWFIKEVLCESWRYFRYPVNTLPVISDHQSHHGADTTVMNHDGLLKLSQQFHGTEVKITCNDLWEVEAMLYEVKPKNNEFEEIPINEMSPAVIKATNVMSQI